MPGFFFNKVAGLRLWQRCFPVNFPKYLRTPFSQNTSGRLHLWFILMIMVVRNKMSPMTKGSFKRYVTPEGGSKLCYEPLCKSGGGEGVSVMPLRNIDKFFHMANFTRNLPIGSYSLYYLTSKTLVFR